MLLRLIHRMFEILLHLERRIEQPFLRPAFNAVFREPLARLLTVLINLCRSRENLGLAEETPQLGEEQAPKSAARSAGIVGPGCTGMAEN